MTLSNVQVPAGRAISDAEAFLGSKHNALGAYQSLEHLVVDGEDQVDAGTFRGLMHHMLVIRSELAKALWRAELYVGISIIDELVFQSVKKGPGPIVQDVLSYLTTTQVGAPGFVLYPLHGFGIERESIFDMGRGANSFLHFRQMGVCLAAQSNDFDATVDTVYRMASRLGVEGKIDPSDLGHHTRAGSMDWFTRNPLMMVRLASHTGAYYENQFVYTLKIRVSSALAAMLYALGADRGNKSDDFHSSARVNNWQTLDIHHYLIGESRGAKSDPVDLRRVPMNVAALDLALLSDLTLTLSPDTLKSAFLRKAQRQFAKALKVVEAGHLAHVNTTSDDRVRRKVYARIVTALDWYRRSFSARVTDDEAVVSLAVAFETLLTDGYLRGGVKDRVERRLRISLRGKRGVGDYVDAVISIMQARGEIVHNGSTLQEAEVIKAQAAFALCFEDVVGRLPGLGSSLDQPIGKVLGDA
ncbi:MULTISPECIES: HEPN domain-containing protein [unclassified Sulfitobacter]|uniref:HEPN domain-containing protein n=3 Tax=Sulfitobacter TaxID=60136 RepID=UPI00083124A2|nr:MULTISPECIES: HEPN domain-containing protein [unclassified Sulfitobacter]